MKKQALVVGIVFAIFFSLTGCGGGGGGDATGASSSSAGGVFVGFNPFRAVATGNGDVRTFTIANLDKIFANEWPKVVRVVIGEGVGIAVDNNIVVPNGTNATFRIVGFGQASFELYGLDANGAKVYIWTKNPDMEPWFHQLRGFTRIGLVIGANGISPLPHGIFTIPRVFRVDANGTCFMASWALACERPITNIQNVTVTYWDASGGPWNGLGIFRAHLEDEWVEVIPRLEEGETKVRVVAELVGGGTAEGRVYFLRQIGSTDVHPTEDRFLVKNQEQSGENPTVPKVKITVSEPESGYALKGSMILTENKALISVATENAYTPTFWLNGQDVTDQFGDLVEDRLWAGNLAVAEGAYTLTVRFFNSRGAQGTAGERFQVIFPEETLEVARNQFLPHVEGGTGAINLATGVVTVNSDGGIAWHVQLRYPLPDDFLETGYFYRIQGQISSEKTGGGNLSPRFQFRESAGSYYVYDGKNIVCNGSVVFDLEPFFTPEQDGGDSSFLIQFGAAGAGSYQLPAEIIIKKVPMP